ncbi:hypothetical protein EDB19DRAFT_2002934 [Suillus lakei]|nr:hypothetical protein EDB19DRAFT_2002934 [Suillus lakei]
MGATAILHCSNSTPWANLTDTLKVLKAKVDGRVCSQSSLQGTISDLHYYGTADAELTARKSLSLISWNTHVQLAKLKKDRKKICKEDNYGFEENGDDLIQSLGRLSSMCPVAVHWHCLAKTLKDEITCAVHARDKVEWKSQQPDSYDGHEPPDSELPNRKELGIMQTTEFICANCMKGSISSCPLSPSSCPDIFDPDDPASVDDIQLASFYQFKTGWRRADCFSYEYTTDKILAWHPHPANAVELQYSFTNPPEPKSLRVPAKTGDRFCLT